MRWLVMPAVGSCQLLAVLSSGFTGPVAISAPVGRGPLARNQSDDVRTIQDALNQVTVAGAAGGPIPFLAVDGICGPRTNAAIARFQQVQLQIFDGVIEPNKNTIVRLNEIIDPVSDDDLRVKVRQALPIVGLALTAAVRNLQAVITSGPTPTGPAATATDRLNRHFGLATLSAAEQSAAHVDLFGSYTRFSTVIMNPELFNIDTVDEFDLDRHNPRIALTQPQGFFEEGREDEDTHRRLDRIHLGLGFFAPSVGAEFAAFIILHELSHFVGRANRQNIGDVGRGWFDDRFMRPLSANQRLSKPPFVRTAPGGLGGAR